MKQIGKYLLHSTDKRLVYKQDIEKGLEVFVDADFAGCFNKSVAEDPVLLYSRTSFIIKYAGCPVIWKSKL